MFNASISWLAISSIPKASAIASAAMDHRKSISMGKLCAWQDIFFAGRDNHMSEEYADLIHEIQRNGILEPITVRKVGWCRYQVIEGFRRYTVASLLDIPKVPVRIVDVGDQEAMRMWLETNKARRDTERWQTVCAIYRNRFDPVFTQSSNTWQEGFN